MNKNAFFNHLQSSDILYSKNIIENTKKKYTEASLIIKEILDNSKETACLTKIDNNVKEIVVNITHKNCTIKSLSRIIEHDYYTHTHSVNVSMYAIYFGKVLNLSMSELKNLGYAAILHDIGKSEIDVTIINKKSTLTYEEYEKMKEHPLIGYNLAKKLGVTNKKVLIGIRNHHERMDGSGYPDKLISSEIEVYAKIIAICDVFDALTTKRSYKDVLKTFEAFKLMKSEKNHFDEELLEKFIRMFQLKE